MNRRLLTTVSLVSLLPAIAGAQASRIADSLLRKVNIDRAESEYYAAVSARPRDPDARWALGRFLIARGATRIGMTLIDEAIQFGFDKRLAVATLEPVYMDLGEYQALDKLSPSPLSVSERALVRWLIEHPSRTTSPDSSLLVAFTRTTIDGYLGATSIRVNGQSVVAQIAPRGGCGIRIADTAAVTRRLRRYPADSTGSVHVPAAADSVSYGHLSLTNVPVSVERLPSGVQAVVCFGALARYAPTFDPKAGLITLRLNGMAPRPSESSTVVPMLNIDGHYSIAENGSWAPMVLPAVTSLLKNHRWTLDAKHGRLVVEP